MIDADVIVLGAGAAGLAAARRLAERSLRTIVIEARPRVGGRVYTVEPVDGAPAELGAEFIHGPAAQTRAILREAGVDAVPSGGDGWAATAAGLVPDTERFGDAGAIIEDALALPHDESVDDYLRRYAAVHPDRLATVARARTFVEGFDAADPARASVRSIAEELHSGVDDASARPVGTYRPLFARLVAACDALGVERRMETPARRVTWRRGTVEIATARGTLSARAAIVTLPLGVLQAAGPDGIAFNPPLPPDKQDALAHLISGHAVKVVLWFRSRWWERIRAGRLRDAGFFRARGGPFTAFWLQQPLRADYVNAWAGGPSAIRLQGRTAEELVEDALEEFGTMLGEPALARAEFEIGQVHDWTRDPFARGAYSYVAVGGASARRTLGAPVDATLFFAGEATSLSGEGGTVNGALATGERAAREAADALQAARRT